MNEEMRIDPDVLRECVTKIFLSAAIPPEQAALVAAHLVEADMVGHPSHGVHRVPWYLQEIAAGKMRPFPDLRPERALDNSEVWDVARGFGIIAAERAMQRAVELAQERTLALVAVRAASHTGRLGAYSTLAARAGCLGLMVLNGGARFVAPFGSGAVRLPPNPLSFSAPIDEHRVMTLDMSTSTSAVGKAQVAALEGRPLPLGFMVNEAGEDVTDAARFLRGGGGHAPAGRRAPRAQRIWSGYDGRGVGRRAFRRRCQPARCRPGQRLFLPGDSHRKLPAAGGILRRDASPFGLGEGLATSSGALGGTLPRRARGRGAARGKRERCAALDGDLGTVALVRGRVGDRAAHLKLDGADGRFGEGGRVVQFCLSVVCWRRYAEAFEVRKWDQEDPVWCLIGATQGVLLGYGLRWFRA